MDEYINTKKTKEMLGVTVKTLRVWDKEGKIRTTRLPFFSYGKRKNLLLYSVSSFTNFFTD